MVDDVKRTLEAEAKAFGLALLGAAPNDYVVAEYARADQHLSLQASRPFDRVLLALAARGPWALRATDGYSRIFAPTSSLRRKLTVLVAILESTSPSDASFAAAERPPTSVLVQLFLTGVGFVLRLGLGMIVIGPIHLACWLKDGDG